MREVTLGKLGGKFSRSEMGELKNIEWDLYRRVCFELARSEMKGTSQDDFIGRYRLEVNGGAMIATSECTFNIGETSAELVNRFGESNVTVQVIEAGEAVISIEDQQAVANAGDLVIRDWLRPHLLVSRPTDGSVKRAKVFTASRSDLEKYLENVDTPEELILRGDAPAARVATSFITSLEENFRGLGDTGVTTFVDSALQLIGNALMLAQEAGDNANGPALMKAQAKLNEHLWDPEMNLSSVAKELGMSPRTVQRLFQSIGTTPREWVETKRVRRIALELKLPKNEGRSITEIAFAFGFNDLSTFSRAFKRRYGVTPRAYRRSANEGIELPELL